MSIHNKNEGVAADLFLLFLMNFLIFMAFPLFGALYFIKMQGPTQVLLSAPTICTRLK